MGGEGDTKVDLFAEVTGGGLAVAERIDIAADGDSAGFGERMKGLVSDPRESERIANRNGTSCNRSGKRRKDIRGTLSVICLVLELPLELILP